MDASITIRDKQGAEGFAQFPLAGSGDHCASLLCVVYRTSDLDSWGVMNVDRPFSGVRTARALVEPAQQHFDATALPWWGKAR